MLSDMGAVSETYKYTVSTANPLLLQYSLMRLRIHTTVFNQTLDSRGCPYFSTVTSTGFVLRGLPSLQGNMPSSIQSTMKA
jgi:hypothetical protein